MFKICISILDYFSFLSGGGGGWGSENLGMNVFVDSFGVTSKIKIFMLFYSSEINYSYVCFMM